MNLPNDQKTSDIVTNGAKLAGDRGRCGLITIIYYYLKSSMYITLAHNNITTIIENSETIANRKLNLSTHCILTFLMPF